MQMQVRTWLHRGQRTVHPHPAKSCRIRPAGEVHTYLKRPSRKVLNIQCTVYFTHFNSFGLLIINGGPPIDPRASCLPTRLAGAQVLLAPLQRSYYLHYYECRYFVQALARLVSDPQILYSP
jgi:hypothetical protein